MDTSRSEQGALVAGRLAEHIDYLRRFARAQARDDELADEAVQETLLAALESGERFAGRAKLRTWLTGILLHKLHDAFRRQSREGTLREAEVTGDFVDFLHAKAIAATASEAASPEHALHNKQLRAALDRALSTLPRRQKEAFLTRELSALESAHAMQMLGVSAGNLWVLLHRARAHLQASLAREGFAPG